MDMGFSDSRALDAGDVATALRPLGWSELCARLVAAQDLRRDQPGIGRHTTPAASGRATGSFHSAAATMLYHYHAGQDFVNPTSSVYGKGNQGKPVISRENSADQAHDAPSRRELP